MKRLIRAFLLLVALGLGLAGCRQPTIPLKPTPTAAPTSTAGSSQPGNRIVTEGRVVPVRSAALSFASGGIVTNVPVTVGEPVAQGQVLAQLDTSLLDPMLIQADANLAVAESRLEEAGRGPADQDVTAARQNLASAQAAYDALVAGPKESDLGSARAALNSARQNYAQVSAGPSAEELAQLSARTANAKAALDQAQAAYDRVAGDPDIGSLPQSVALERATNDYGAAVAAYKAAAGRPTASELAAAAAQVQSAQAALDRLTPDQAQIQAALAAVAGARAQLGRIQPSEDELAILKSGVRVAMASRDLAAAQIRNATLLAPFAGTAVKLGIDRGEYAAPGAEILLLADTSAWRVETTDLTELNVAEVAEGAKVTMTFDAIPGLELPGHVTMVDPYGESRQGDIVYAVTIVPDRHEPRLRWNMTAKVSIESR